MTKSVAHQGCLFSGWTWHLTVPCQKDPRKAFVGRKGRSRYPIIYGDLSITSAPTASRWLASPKVWLQLGFRPLDLAICMWFPPFPFVGTSSGDGSRQTSIDHQGKSSDFRRSRWRLFGTSRFLIPWLQKNGPTRLTSPFPSTGLLLFWGCLPGALSQSQGEPRQRQDVGGEHVWNWCCSFGFPFKPARKGCLQKHAPT